MVHESLDAFEMLLVGVVLVITDFKWNQVLRGSFIAHHLNDLVVWNSNDDGSIISL